MTPILSEILAKPIEAGLFYNVNLPILPAQMDDPEVVWCSLDPNPLPLNYRQKKRAASIMPATTNYGIAHPERT